MSEASIMSPVGQEIEEPLNSSILFNSDSTSSLLVFSQNSIATEEIVSDTSMDQFQVDRFSASDTEADSAITLLKSLNSESPSSSFVSRRNDNSAIIRLNNELLKAKRSNWEVVDALGKAYEDIKNLRLREQRLNAILLDCTGKHAGKNGFPESLSLPDSKIIELQLALRREEAVKTREDLRAMIEERDRLKEKLGKSESDRRLISLTSDQREKQIEFSQMYISDLIANIKEKDAEIFSAQDKLIFLEEQAKTKDEEMKKICEEKNNLRDAVIRSEREIESLTEKLQKLSLPKQRHAKYFTQGTDHTQEVQTFDSVGEVSLVEPNMMEKKSFRDDTKPEREMQFLESRHNQDLKVIHELNSKLKEWESFVKSINDYVLDTNQQQLQARIEIADYVKMVEQQLHELKKYRSIWPINETDGGLRCSSKAIQQRDMGHTEEVFRDHCQVFPQEVEQSQAGNVNFERYLKSSLSDFDQDGIWKDISDNDPFDTTDEEDDFELASGFRSSALHLVQPDNVRMARVTTIDGFVPPYSPPGIDDAEDSKTPKRPPRKTKARKRRKLPDVTRKLSKESGHSIDSLVTRSDETASVTSFESQPSRHNANLHRVSRDGSNGRLPPVPSGEEIDLSQRSINKDGPATELPSVMSIYKGKEPTRVNNYSQDSELGKSVKNAPVAPSSSDHAGHRFSLSSLRGKFSKGKANSGSHVDVDSVREPKKGLFQQKLSLLRRRKRRNSIGTLSNASESFRTITPLNSDEEGVGDIGNESFDGGRCHAPRTTSSPNSKGGCSRQSRHLSDRRRRACLWLVFQRLNPIELCGLARVCREWREISEHSSLWKHVTLEDIPLNNMALQAVSRRCSCTQILKLKGLRITRSTRETSHSSKPDDMSCYLERGLEFLLKATGPSLLSLHIEDCGVFLTDRCLALAGCYCRELKEMVYISDAFPACPEALWALWACRQLQTLRVPPMFPSDHPGRFNDKSLETISNCWPNLRQLTVGGPSVTSAGLIHIAKGCLRLQELELDRTLLISEEVAHTLCLCGLRGLETISFTFTPVYPGAIKELLGACPRLERIEVHIGISDYFTNVEDDVSERKYKRIVKKLKDLKRENQEFARVLWIKSDYG